MRQNPTVIVSLLIEHTKNHKGLKIEDLSQKRKPFILTINIKAITMIYLREVVSQWVEIIILVINMESRQLT